MKDAALRLAQKGLAVFPCRPRDKIPHTAHGCKDATKDAEQVAAWWTQWPEANIAIATGGPSGVWVLDIDGEAGEATLRDLEKRMGALPPTVESITGGGGRHLFYKLPDFAGAPQIRNSARQLGDGLDVRGEGGYVIAPPSVHPSGRKYAWSVDSAGQFADAPTWLLALLTAPKVADLDEHRGSDHWKRVAQGAGEGTRNHSAASLAGYLMRLGARPDVALELLLGWNTRNTPPLPETEIIRTVESIAERELMRRTMR